MTTAMTPSWEGGSFSDGEEIVVADVCDVWFMQDGDSEAERDGDSAPSATVAAAVRLQAFAPGISARKGFDHAVYLLNDSKGLSAGAIRRAGENYAMKGYETFARICFEACSKVSGRRRGKHRRRS